MIDEIEIISNYYAKHSLQNHLVVNNWIKKSIIFQSFNSIIIFRL